MSPVLVTELVTELVTDLLNPVQAPSSRVPTAPLNGYHTHSTPLSTLLKALLITPYRRPFSAHQITPELGHP